MTATAVTLEEVAELASQLSPEEQSRLLARIAQRLSVALARTAGESVPGSPSLVVRAMQGEPHVSSEDVDELDRMIAAGRLPVRPEGVFDSENRG